MHGMGEFEAALLVRSLRQRKALQQRPLAAPAGDQDGLELGVGAAEIAGVGEPGIRELRLESAVAVGAEALRRRRHRLPALMLGMAFDAAARRDVEPLLEGQLDPRQRLRSGRARARRYGSAWSWTEVWQALQAVSRTASNGLTWQAVHLSLRPAWACDRLPDDHNCRRGSARMCRRAAGDRNRP
jgi:hypothetical protein